MSSLAVLAGRFDRLLWGLAAIVVAVLLAHLLKLVVYRLEQRRRGEERELLRLRRRETAVVLLATGRDVPRDRGAGDAPKGRP